MQKVDRAERCGSAEEDRAACVGVTHSGPPPRLRDGGEVGVFDVTLHSVHHGGKHEDSHADEEQQTSHLHTQARVTSQLLSGAFVHVLSSGLGCTSRSRPLPPLSKLTRPQETRAFPPERLRSRSTGTSRHKELRATTPPFPRHPRPSPAQIKQGHRPRRRPGNSPT